MTLGQSRRRTSALHGQKEPHLHRPADTRISFAVPAASAAAGPPPEPVPGQMEEREASFDGQPLNALPAAVGQGEDAAGNASIAADSSSSHKSLPAAEEEAMDSAATPAVHGVAGGASRRRRVPARE